MHNAQLEELLHFQSGVVRRAQLIDAGLAPHEIRRLLRSRWVVVHPGVYVNHTGPLTWVQRAWVGVLAVWPAALCGESALRAAEGPGRRGARTTSMSRWLGVAAWWYRRACG